MDGFYPILVVPNVSEVADWMEQNLFFERDSSENRDMVINGSCRILLIEGEMQPLPTPIKGTYYTGPAHIALRTADIDKAIAWCQSRMLNLQLEEGHSFYNPKVYENGEKYFNIASPFGVTFEVSQRILQSDYKPVKTIEGLDHLGIPSENLEQQLQYLIEQGFVPEFETVTNWNEKEGTIYCTMISKNDIVLEVYEFADMKAKPMPKNVPFRSINNVQIMD